jgi:UDP-glucose 4-epimerase
MLVADPKLLKRTLGLDPGTFAGLTDIVETAWCWHARRQGC